MASSWYSRGRDRARSALGLDEDHTLRNIAVGGAAAAPFMGLIGQKKLLHDPHMGAKPMLGQMDVHKLMMEAQPGDIVAYSLGKGGKQGIYPQLFESLLGTPYHHVEAVVGKHEGLYGKSIAPGQELTGDITSSVPEQLNRVKTIGQHAAEGGYRDVILLRPKQFMESGGQITPEIQRFIDRGVLAGREPFVLPRGIKGVLRDLFIPKIRGLTDRSTTQALGDAYKGMVCSTGTCEALAAGTGQRSPVVPGKGAREVLPPDFLRSPNLRLIAHAPGPEAITQAGKYKRLARNLGIRAGIGLGLAGATYGISEDPTATALAAGAATPWLVRGALGKRLEHPMTQLPKLKHLVYSYTGPSEFSKAIQKGFRRRTLPLMAAGGLAAYLAARKAKSAIQD